MTAAERAALTAHKCFSVIVNSLKNGDEERTMITADQLVAHAMGDYVLQSDWMATRKTKEHVAAAVHAAVYTGCFLPLTRAPLALAIIFGTHFLIDRYRLARYVVWAKNFLAPRVTVVVEYTTACIGPSGRELYDETNTIERWWRPWAECQSTGYPPERPVWLAVWLLIIADNVLHVLINGAALALVRS